MNFLTRKPVYEEIEKRRDSKVVAFVTSDRSGMETQIAQDSVDLFVSLLDAIGPTKRISLILHTNGGQTLAAWRLVNLLRTFCDELEVIVPATALRAGTLICIGGDKIIMTKQAVLGPIDPSVNNPLNPGVNVGNQVVRVPVSVENLRGYLDAIRQELEIKGEAALSQLLITLADHVHPLVMGEVFRSRAQIRFLAEKLLKGQVPDKEKMQSIIDFLCADSGSHDYSINRREARECGLNVDKPDQELYDMLKSVHASYDDELKVLSPYSHQAVLGGNANATYSETRGLVEATVGGCYQFVSEGLLTHVTLNTPMGQQIVVSDQRNFEGWRKV